MWYNSHNHANMYLQNGFSMIRRIQSRQQAFIERNVQRISSRHRSLPFNVHAMRSLEQLYYGLLHGSIVKRTPKLHWNKPAGRSQQYDAVSNVSGQQVQRSHNSRRLLTLGRQNADAEFRKIPMTSLTGLTVLQSVSSWPPANISLKNK